MTDTGAKAVSLLEAWEKRDFEGVMRHLADNASVTDLPRGLTIKDRGEIRSWFESWATACPDSTAGGSVAVATDDVAVFEGIYVGTNTGPLGPLPATGRSVAMPFALVISFDGEARVVGYNVYYDQLTLLTQLGHAPAPA